MKNIFNSALLLITASIALSCGEDELRTHYPYSLPVISNAAVAESEVLYGDSITVSLDVADPVTPLSTLEVRIVVNDVVVNKETIRTKGNSASFQKRYQVPFGPYMPGGAAVEVHLTSVNVEGNQAGQVIASTTGVRPEIPQVYLVLTTGGTTRLPCTDPDNHVYSVQNLSFGNEISFYLAEKVSRFGNVDWTGKVFGYRNGEPALIEQGGDPCTLSDLTLIGFNAISVDLLNFTISGSGEKLVPITGMDVTSFEIVQLTSTDHLGVAVKEDWGKAQLYFGKDTEIEITGIPDLANGMTPDFFEVAGANKVKFLGETGVYTVYHLPSAGYVYLEQPAAIYPDALWLDGVGFGRPQTPYQKTSSWNWNSPLEYIFCRKVSPGVFQATFYAQHEENTTDAENAWRYKFNVKFFGQRGWGEEIDAREYALSTPLLTAPTTEELGNFIGTSSFTSAPGVYRFTLDTNTKTATFVKVN
jgi:hypothetical protein